MMTRVEWLAHCAVIASGPTCADLDVHFPTKWVLRQHWIARFGPNCLDCGHRMTRSIITLDHILCRALGGSEQLSNKRFICVSCNNAKSLIEWQVSRQHRTPANETIFPSVRLPTDAAGVSLVGTDQ